MSGMIGATMDGVGRNEVQSSRRKNPARCEAQVAAERKTSEKKGKERIERMKANESKKNTHRTADSPTLTDGLASTVGLETEAGAEDDEPGTEPGTELLDPPPPAPLALTLTLLPPFPLALALALALSLAEGVGVLNGSEKGNAR
jgi:hypothetical protein